MSDTRVILDRAAIDRALESPQGDVGKELARRTIRVHRAALNLCAVDTGRLRASVAWRLANDSQGLLGIVGTNVEYAPHVEFGTRYMAAQPFLRPALSAG